VIDIKDHRKYPDNYFIGCYIMQEPLINSLLEWKELNKEFGKKTSVQNKEVSNKDIIKVCLEWGIENNNMYYPWGNYQKALKNCIDKYFSRYPQSQKVTPFLHLERIYNLQHYKPGEGFWAWHKENIGDKESIRRHLVFMTYLTTTPNAGTEFQAQNLTVPCEKGVTLIWPAGWTHTHRGQISNTHEKTIVTGWITLSEE
tara:strand:- start:86 stop:685 length:600 start_codon:yes stop_codon:yes gene_type:complete